jgi:hypothetical protein
VAEIEVLDFVQILFNPEPITVSINEEHQREGPAIRVLLSALRTVSVDAAALIT